MAGKQFGKFRQWAGEVISSREKTLPSSEFLALEKGIEVRKEGLEKLQIASTDYMESVARKIQSEAMQGDDKFTFTEALGIVMIRAGEKLGADCALGRCLSTFGRAHCRVAAIQNIFAVTLADTFIAHLGHSLGAFEEYATLRKKLENRRLAYDAAITKAEKCKSSKKEKDRKEAEDEQENARLKYEEASDELRENMDTIRDAEVGHQRELKRFLDLETKSVEQHLEALKEVQRDWPDIDFTPSSRQDSRLAFPHAFDRTSSRSSDSRDSNEPKPVAIAHVPVVPPRPDSRRSNRSVRSGKVGVDVAEKNEDETPEEPPSRPLSRISRKLPMKTPRSRANSVATDKSVVPADEDGDVSPSKANGKHKKASSSVSVSTWMGDAMSSVMSRSKPRVANKETFSALADDDDDNADDRTTEGKRSRRSSVRSTKSNGVDKNRQSVQSVFDKGNKRVMKATSDFSGSHDELSFKVGDEITVLQETVDDWWLGELDGRKGLFPSNHVTALKTSPSQTGLSSKSRNASASSILGLAHRSRAGSKHTIEEEEIRRTLVGGAPSDSDLTSDAESMDQWDSFDDRDSSLEMHSEQGHLKPADTPVLPVRPSGIVIPGVPSSQSVNESPVKKMPPPPPPRRQQTSSIPKGPPPLPERNTFSSRAHSMGAVPTALVPPVADVRRAHSETNSPFDSQSELSFETIATTYAPSGTKCATCKCDDFVEDPFRGQNLCANCTHSHD